MQYRLPLDHQNALRDVCTWLDNPFVKRESRRDRKRKQLPKSLIGLALVMLILGGGLLYGLATANKQFHGVPWWLGGDPILALFMIASGLHVWFIMGTAQRGTLLLFAQEANGSTLMHLLMVPASRFQLVLQTALYPWLSGMRMALLLLPFYIVCVALQKVTWIELFCMYLFFSAAALSFPLLRKPGIGDTAPSLPTQQTTLNSQQAPTAGAFASTDAQNARAAQQGGTGAGGWSIMAFMVPMAISMFAFAAGRGAPGMYMLLSKYVPDNIIQIMPASMISWPLLIARLLISPLAWFGFHIWPIVFCVPLTLVQRYMMAVRTAEFLQVGTYRDLATLPTYVYRRRLEAWYRGAVTFAAIGYLWKWLVVNGGIAWLLPVQMSAKNTGLTSFLYVILCLSGYTVLSRITEYYGWARSNQQKKSRLALRAINTNRSIRYILLPLVSTIAFYFVCCALAFTNPLPRECQILGGQMLCLIAASALIGAGADAALGGYSTIPKLIWCIATVAAYNSYGFVWAKWLGTLSPLLGFASISQATHTSLSSFFQNTQWWHFAAAQSAVGFLLAGVGYLRTRRVPALDPEYVPDTELDPTIYGTEVFRDELTIAMEGATRTETPFALAVIAFVQRFADNAVAIKELRSRLRGRLSSSTIRNATAGLVIASVAMFQFPEFPSNIGEALADGLYGTISTDETTYALNIPDKSDTGYTKTYHVTLQADSKLTLNTTEVDSTTPGAGFVNKCIFVGFKK